MSEQPATKADELKQKIISIFIASEKEAEIFRQIEDAADSDVPASERTSARLNYGDHMSYKRRSDVEDIAKIGATEEDFLALFQMIGMRGFCNFLHYVGGINELFAMKSFWIAAIKMADPLIDAEKKFENLRPLERKNPQVVVANLLIKKIDLENKNPAVADFSDYDEGAGIVLALGEIAPYAPRGVHTALINEVLDRLQDNQTSKTETARLACILDFASALLPGNSPDFEKMEDTIKGTLTERLDRAIAKISDDKTIEDLERIKGRMSAMPQHKTLLDRLANYADDIYDIAMKQRLWPSIRKDYVLKFRAEGTSFSI